MSSIYWLQRVDGDEIGDYAGYKFEDQADAEKMALELLAMDVDDAIADADFEGRIFLRTDLPEYEIITARIDTVDTVVLTADDLDRFIAATRARLEARP